MTEGWTFINPELNSYKFQQRVEYTIVPESKTWHTGEIAHPWDGKTIGILGTGKDGQTKKTILFELDGETTVQQIKACIRQLPIRPND